MTLEAQLAALDGGLGSQPLPGGDLLRLAGKDALAALDRVVTQEVKTLREGDGRLALLLAPKGQFRALTAVFRLRDEALLLAPPGRGASLAAKLSAYLKFSRVAIEPLGVDGGAWRVLGSGWRRVAEALGLAPGAPASSGCAGIGAAGERLIVLGQTFLGVDGATIAAESAPARVRLNEAMAVCGAVTLADEAAELARIRSGLPAWGAELTETVLPPEVGIELLAISYTKGCYVGQETIARMKTYGHPNRALVGLRQTSGPEYAPALPHPLAAAGEEKARGMLTSWGLHPKRGGIGLALARRELAAPGTALTAGDRTFAVVPFPLW